MSAMHLHQWNEARRAGAIWTAFQALLAASAMAWCAEARSQALLENVIVETYYLSDANDASDTNGGGLAEGSRTYRVYIDLATGGSLRAVYGSSEHPLSIASTANFFNHIDRGYSFGHMVNTNWLDEGTTAVDSWLALGAATSQRMGIAKADDDDGSLVGGANNDGGSAAVPGGLLVNDAVEAGIPLTTSDGLVVPDTGAVLPPNFNVQGEEALLDSVFDDSTARQSFLSTTIRFGCSSPGVVGPTPDNRILVAQLTTTGEISFSLNIEVQNSAGEVVKFVAKDTLLAADETPAGLLNYPPVCGCTDPDFLEYDPNAGCDDGSCATAIVFGCLDTLACNFDPTANFMVQELCCYGPDDCNGLDVSLVCPDLGIDPLLDAAQWRIHPVPVVDRLSVIPPVAAPGDLRLIVSDATGRTVLEQPGSTTGYGSMLDMERLPAGPYVLRAIWRGGRTAWPLIKQ